jgi:hypothetical protein
VSSAAHNSCRTKGLGMIIIVVDPHKQVHTASAVDPRREQADSGVGSRGVTGRLPPVVDMGRGSVSGAGGRERPRFGAAPHTVAGGPARPSRMCHPRRRHGFGSCPAATGGNDVIDAAAAGVAALHGDANPVVAEDRTTVLSLLDDWRDYVPADPAGQPASRTAGPDARRRLN